MLWFAFAAPAVVDVALDVHHTSLLTNNAQQVCALIRGQLSYESGCFCGDILFVLFSGDTLASSDTLILSFWGDFGTSFLRLSCCADREGSNHHHLHMGISSGSSETSVSDVSEEVCCLVYDVALSRKAACARCPWLSCELHVLTAVPSPACAALLCCLTWTELLDKPISAGSCFCTACQGRNPALGLYFCQVMPHPALCRDLGGEMLRRRCLLSIQIHIWPQVFQVVGVFRSYLQDLLWSWGWHTSSSSLFRKASCLAT